MGLLLSQISACRTQTPLTRSEYLLDTIVTVTLYGGGDEETLSGAMELAAHYDRLWSVTLPDSDIVRINTARGHSVQVDGDTARLLSEALYYHGMSAGAFAVTIGPVTALWDFTGDNPIIPDDGRLKQALSHVGDSLLKVDGNTVTLGDPEGAVDVGGIAKGYIADRLKEYLAEQGVNSAILDLGGNIYALGSKNGKDFKVGIQAPFAENAAMTASVRVRDKSVVTSGIYQRCFTVDGRLYHHILSPETGKPVDNGLASVTILSDSSCEGDALSTICYLLGEAASRELLAGLGGPEAIFVRRDGTVSATGDVKYQLEQ